MDIHSYFWSASKSSVVSSSSDSEEGNESEIDVQPKSGSGRRATKSGKKLFPG